MEKLVLEIISFLPRELWQQSEGRVCCEGRHTLLPVLSLGAERDR